MPFRHRPTHPPTNRVTSLCSRCIVYTRQSYALHAIAVSTCSPLIHTSAHKNAQNPPSLLNAAGGRSALPAASSGPCSRLWLLLP
jgi:hypothetical protein